VLKWPWTNWAFREPNRSYWRETVEAIRVPNVNERKRIPMQAIRAVVSQIAEPRVRYSMSDIVSEWVEKAVGFTDPQPI
jgi:hypothetical protein